MKQKFLALFAEKIDLMGLTGCTDEACLAA